MTVNLVRKKKDKPPTFKGHYAGFVSRLVAFVIDILIVSINDWHYPWNNWLNFAFFQH